MTLALSGPTSTAKEESRSSIRTSAAMGCQAIFDLAEKERFKIRTIVERANSHLKDWLLLAQLFMKRIARVSFVLSCGVLCLAAFKILQHSLFS